MTVFDGVLIGILFGTILGGLIGYQDGRAAERKHQEELYGHTK
jgi:hypothetical protein